MSTTTSYTVNNVTIDNMNEFKGFLFTMMPREKKLYSINYNSTTKVATITTRESAYSSDTDAVVQNMVKVLYPNPPYRIPIETDSPDLSGNAVSSISVYGYFPQSAINDGVAVINQNTSLTRNMYYSDLTVNSGVTLNANGWRIVVTGTLTLDGIISNDGTDAVSTTPGTGTAPIYTTYLGAGSSGGPGLTTSGPGISGGTAQYSCSGGAGGVGGGVGLIYPGGSGGSYMAVSPVDGGLNTLSTMPIAFMGRLLSNNFYVMGGTGGGGGGCNKGNATTVKSGAGGGAGGFMIIAAKNIVGSGLFSAKGGNGSSATWTAALGKYSSGIGGGGGGGGGCIIIITQGTLVSTVKFNVSGGAGGSGVSPGKDGVGGSDGNIFVITV